ncbi:MAG TPA: hypothetical protein VF276_01740 [Chloroflexia bacterium]
MGRQAVGPALGQSRATDPHVIGMALVGMPFLALLPRATHVRLPGVSHVLHNEQPVAVLAAMRPFLAAVRAMPA